MDKVGAVPLGLLVIGLTAVAVTPAAAQTPPFGAFAFVDSVTVPGEPGAVFDQFVSVDAWWDHRFSEAPAQFYIEAKPGGGFWELFDDAGNGVRHATVIAVQRGAMLRMEGPLGMSGKALHMVHSLDFTRQGDSTLVHLEVRGAGELDPEWPGLIQGVWHHFLAERFKPYAEGRLD